jgi:hypothetical protein
MDELLQRLLDGQIEREEMTRLQQAIRDDSNVRDYYVDSMLACGVLRRSSQAIGEDSESDLIRALAGDRHRADSQRRVPRRYWIAAILIVGVSILTSLSVFWPRDPGPALGKLSGAYEAHWRGLRTLPGDSLYAGRYELVEGVAQMELNQGTNLLLEAPCRIELKGHHEVTLTSGRLVAAVSPQATGFRVQTPTALITDLGTEFGVIAHADGSTEAHLLKGRIRVACKPKRSGRPATSLIVNENQAATVDTGAQTIRDGLAARADLFLRQLPSSNGPVSPSEGLSLADIVGGGNGRGTGRLDRGIDVGTGQAFKSLPTRIGRVRQSAFLPTPQFRYIDGVFVPNGGLGPVRISSTGLVFSECPQTMSSYFGGPANSARFFDLLSQQTYTVRLNGVCFGTFRHPALSLHANAGITFDLDAMRRDHPTIEIDRFTAVCGMPKDLPRPRFSAGDAWILLDGEVHLHRRFPREQSVVETVDVPIPTQTRFLTLVTTCSGRADFSWIVFGDPYLGPDADNNTGRRSNRNEPG